MKHFLLSFLSKAGYALLFPFPGEIIPSRSNWFFQKAIRLFYISYIVVCPNSMTLCEVSFIGCMGESSISICLLHWALLVVWVSLPFPYVCCIELYWLYGWVLHFHMSVALSFIGCMGESSISICLLHWALLVVWVSPPFPYVCCIELYWLYGWVLHFHMSVALSFIGCMGESSISICLLHWALLVVWVSPPFPYVCCIELYWLYGWVLHFHISVALSFIGCMGESSISTCLLNWHALMVLYVYNIRTYNKRYCPPALGKTRLVLG